MSTSTFLNCRLLSPFIHPVWLATSLALCLGWQATGEEDAAEQVAISTEFGPVVHRGFIENYSQSELRLERAQGGSVRIAASRIVSVRYRKSKPHLAGDQAYAAGDFETALREYQDAQSLAKRKWVREEALIQTVRCFQNLGRLQDAAEVYLAIVTRNAESRHFDAAPLAWRPRSVPRKFSERAALWMETDDGSETTQLIGASWSLVGTKRSRAVERLRRLRASREPWIRQMATAQLWRIEGVTATSSEAAQWWTDLQEFPPKMKGGPAFVLGQVQQRHGQTDEAVLSYLQAAFAQELADDVKQEALAAAINLLESAHPDEAKRLRRELRQVTNEILIQ